MVVGDYVLHHCTGLTAEQRALLVSDFETGKQSIMMQLRLKLSPWRVLPLRLLGLGHFNEAESRRTALVCLGQYQRVPADRHRHLHSVSQVLLSRSGPPQGFRSSVGFREGSKALFDLDRSRMRGQSSPYWVTACPGKLCMSCRWEVLPLAKQTRGLFPGSIGMLIRKLGCSVRRAGAMRQLMVDWARGATWADVVALKVCEGFRVCGGNLSLFEVGFECEYALCKIQ